jgi:hypothetical protein
MKIKENIVCWILHTTLVDNDGKFIDQQLYQHSSAVDMLALYKERRQAKVEWETEKNAVVKYHLDLRYILDYSSAGVLVSNLDAEKLLESHAKQEQALIDANKA